MSALQQSLKYSTSFKQYWYYATCEAKKFSLVSALEIAFSITSIYFLFQCVVHLIAVDSTRQASPLIKTWPYKCARSAMLCVCEWISHYRGSSSGLDSPTPDYLLQHQSLTQAVISMLSIYYTHRTTMTSHPFLGQFGWLLWPYLYIRHNSGWCVDWSLLKPGDSQWPNIVFSHFKNNLGSK